MLVLKFEYNGEFRRATIEDSSVDSLGKLKSKLKAMVPTVDVFGTVGVYWKDPEGDDITISSNEDVLEALLTGVSTSPIGNKTLRLYGIGAQDLEKRKLIQQQLILLLHAHKCQQRDREAPNGQRPCILPFCSTMKNVLSHMTSCKTGKDCQYPHCSSSRQIIAHWKNCKRPDCRVCLPLKQVTQNAGSNADNILSQFYNPQAGPGSFMPLTELTASDLLSGGVSVPLPASSNPASQQCNTYICSSGSVPEGTSVQKEWHKQVTQDLRNHLVSKLVKAIFPSPDPAAINDQRIKDLIAYARKLEKELFEKANDREEYDHLIAEKIYIIQNELQEKKQKRLQQQHAEDIMRKDDGLHPNRTVPMDPYNCPPLSVPRSNTQPRSSAQPFQD